MTALLLRLKPLLSLAGALWRAIGGVGGPGAQTPPTGPAGGPVGGSGPIPAPAAPPAPAGSGAQSPDFYLHSRQLQAVRELRGAYETAVRIVGGLPWQAIAAVHYREAEFAQRSTIPGGPFQLDPGGTGQELQERIEAYVQAVRDKYGLLEGGTIDSDFWLAAVVAAHELRSKVRAEIAAGSVVDGEVLADALWGYNGRSRYHTASGLPEGESSWRYSPYVSNDPKRGVVLRIRGTVPDATVQGGRRMIDRPDPRPGAMIVYRELLARASELG